MATASRSAPLASHESDPLVVGTVVGHPSSTAVRGAPHVAVAIVADEATVLSGASVIAPQIYMDPATGNFAADSYSSRTVMWFSLVLLVASVVFAASVLGVVLSQSGLDTVILVLDLMYCCCVIPGCAFVALSNARKVHFDFNDVTACAVITVSYTFFCCHNSQRAIPYRMLECIEARPKFGCREKMELLLKIANGETLLIRPKDDRMPWQQRYAEWWQFVESRKALVR